MRIANPDFVGWNKKKNEHNASQDAGKIWEWEALKHIQDAGYPYYAVDKNGIRVENVLDVTDKKNGFSDILEGETMEFFRNPFVFLADLNEKKSGYAYQTTIKVEQGDLFIKDVILHNTEYREKIKGMFNETDELLHANWRKCKPDLIRVDVKEDGTTIFSVIDIKHAKRAKVSHKVQVAIYVKLLETVFKENDIPGEVNRETGYLWNFKKDEPKGFDLKTVMPFVDQFFDTILPKTILKLKKCQQSDVKDIFNKTFPAVPSQMCDWCDNYENCISWQKKHEPMP